MRGETRDGAGEGRQDVTWMDSGAGVVATRDIRAEPPESYEPPLRGVRGVGGWRRLVSVVCDGMSAVRLHRQA